MPADRPRSAAPKRGGPAAGLLLAVSAALAGCAPGHDPIDTPVAWWHDLQGGVIAEDRPPPPGVDAPYPHIGTTPARPVLPSVAARDAITASLLDRRAQSNAADAHDPIVPPPAAVPAASPAAAPPTELAAAPGAPTRSSVTIGDAPAPAVPGAPQPAPPPPSQPPPVPSPERQEAGEPMLAMPAMPVAAAVVVAGPTPQMPRSPPAAASVAGFAVPQTRLASARPDYAAPAGAGRRETPLDFAPASDVLLRGGHEALRDAARTHGDARIRVTGFGDATADDPDEQALALRLALARAASAAQSLSALGVPADRIVIAAASFGRGGEVAILP